MQLLIIILLIALCFSMAIVLNVGLSKLEKTLNNKKAESKTVEEEPIKKESPDLVLMESDENNKNFQFEEET